MLVGKYENSVDTKNRMIVPAKFRDDLGDKCIVSKAIEKCLDVYPMEEWKVFREKLRSLPDSKEEVRRFKRHFLSGASECEIDKQGRLTLPQDLRGYAGIERELVTIGFDRKLEVWSKDEYQRKEDTEGMTAEELAESMEEYGF